MNPPLPAFQAKLPIRQDFWVRITGPRGLLYRDGVGTDLLPVLHPQTTVMAVGPLGETPVWILDPRRLRASIRERIVKLVSGGSGMTEAQVSSDIDAHRGPLIASPDTELVSRYTSEQDWREWN